MTKSTKSHQRERSPLFENSSPVSATPTNALRALVHSPRARVSRASHAWQVCAAKDRAKIGSFTALRSLNHTTRANIASEPSRYSLTIATGSKRSSADSDLLLCHVRLWRTSRLSFWRKYGCEHSEIGFVSAIYCSNTSSVAVNRATFSHWRRLAKILAFVSACTGFTPAVHFQRACRQCVHESARLPRALCSHAWYG